MFDLSQFDLLSQLSHFLNYSVGKPKMSLDKGMLIVSTDIDVGSSELGYKNGGRLDRDINLQLSEYQIGKIEELAIPLILKVFDDFEVPITLAVRGQLTEINGNIINDILDSTVRHDIGAHGYYHRQFTDLTFKEAEDELYKISLGFKEYNISPLTFIFPRNRVAHLALLEKYKYVCYRGYGDIFKDCMNIEKSGGLYNIHPSIFINQDTRLILLRRILDIAIARRLPLHVWFHFWNFGENEKLISSCIKNLFTPFLLYAKKRQREGLLTFETMLSAAQKLTF